MRVILAQGARGTSVCEMSTASWNPIKTPKLVSLGAAMFNMKTMRIKPRSGAKRRRARPFLKFEHDDLT